MFYHFTSWKLVEKAEPLIAPLVPGGGLFRIEDIAEVSYNPREGRTLFEIGMVWRDCHPDLGAAGLSPSIYGQVSRIQYI